ncbi:MAG TPA: Tat pathway signal protein, partial [Blastocatellia bacterium]|nr:Tat pathway signal protein [Blastocatellia bacterium]
MNRRSFLQNVAVASAAISLSSRTNETAATAVTESAPMVAPDIAGHTLIAEFRIDVTTWKVYEDLRTRDGVLTFVSSRGEARVLGKSAEATFAEAEPAHLGLSMNDIGLADADLLADRLLTGGDDPDPEKVKAAAPPLGSATPPPGSPGAANPRTRWTTFVGTVEAFDVAPVYYGGNTRTYHPVQVASDIRDPVAQGRVFDGLIGGWMPAVRKIIPISDTIHYEIIVFGDVEAHDKFIVQTWHRTARIENGKMVQAIYGYSYPPFPPSRTDPKPEAFYRALLIFADYWERQLRDFAPASLPQNVWIDMSKHAFAKELMIRPGGIYPKYGAVDRDYFGSEYDGFQDIFTMAVYTQLEWGRFETARKFIDNYFTDFVDAKGMVNMRGPETAQFGLTLSLLARYFNYTRDAELLAKHRAKIRATARLLAELHDESLKLPADNPGHGLIHGWSESDACLAPNPKVWWQPYFANSAFAARGFKDIAGAWRANARSDRAMQAEAEAWLARSKSLQDATIASIEKNIKKEKRPPYIGPLPGAKLTFRESMAQERPSPQQWPHRPYTELLQADMLPANLANLVIDCMRAYGATTIGVVANVSVARP